VLSCAIGLVRYWDCARFTLCAIETWAIGLVRYRELCQFFVCYRVGALSHRALTEPARVRTRLVLLLTHYSIRGDSSGMAEGTEKRL